MHSTRIHPTYHNIYVRQDAYAYNYRQAGTCSRDMNVSFGGVGWHADVLTYIKSHSHSYMRRRDCMMCKQKKWKHSTRIHTPQSTEFSANNYGYETIHFILMHTNIGHTLQKSWIARTHVRIENVACFCCCSRVNCKYSQHVTWISIQKENVRCAAPALFHFMNFLKHKMNGSERCANEIKGIE